MASNIPPNPLMKKECVPFLNKHAIELYKDSLIYKDVGQYKIVHAWTCELIKIDPSEVNIDSLFSKIKSTYKKYILLKKRKGDESYNFEKSVFNLPVSKENAPPNKSGKSKLYSEGEDIPTNKRQKLEDKICILKNINTKVNKKLQQTYNSVEKLKLKYRNMKTMVKSKSKASQTENNIYCNKGVQCNIERVENAKLKQQLNYLDNRCCLLSEEKETKDLKSTRLCSQGRPFAPVIRQVCYDFLSRGVSSDIIPFLIISCIKNLTDIDICENDLPSPSCISTMNIELGHISRQQIPEKLEQENNLTMLRDGTTKKGAHIYGVKISTDKEIFTAGLREVSQGTSEELFKITEKIMHDIEDAPNKKSMTDNVLKHVTSLMTDRCATELKVNKMFNEVKMEKLEKSGCIKSNKDKDSQDIQEFKCSVHPLLQFAAECDKVVKKYETEKSISYKLINNKAESGCHAFLRNVSKLLYKDGTGDPCLLHAYLSQRVSRIPVAKFKGNRFNIFVYNAAGVYILRNRIKDYLECTKSTFNLIQDMVLSCLKVPLVMALCRAVGIMYYSVTLPYWNECVKKSKSAIEMGPVYKHLIERLEKWSKTVHPLLNGTESLNTNACPIDEEYKLLYKETIEQSFVESVLKDMCFVVLEKSKKLFSDFLENGKYANPCQEIIMATKSCPPNNITLERLMAQCDRSIVIAPNSNMSSRESKIMYKDNKSALWLENKKDEEKKNILKKALDAKPTIEKNEKIRKSEIRKEYVEILKKRQEDKKKKEQKHRHAAEKLVKSIRENGYWASEDEVDMHLSKCKNKTEQLELLKQQINARKKLLGQKVSNKLLFQFSSKGQKFSVDTLRLHLLQLINIHLLEEEYDNQNFDVTQISDNPKSVVNRYIHHTWNDAEEGVDRIWAGKILAFIPSKNLYKIAYWNEDIEDEEDALIYELTIKEITQDCLDNTLVFL